MGKWVQVYCGCDNRTPLVNSSRSARPYNKKRRLTNREKQEVEEWERTTERMYECGHRGGVVVEFYPGAILVLGSAIASVLPDPASAFEIFRKVGDWRCYVDGDELLLISSHQAALWLLEIDEIRRGFQGIGNAPLETFARVAVEVHQRELDGKSTLEARVDKVAERVPFSRIVSVKKELQESETPEMRSTLKTIDSALAEATTLCNASIELQSPIRFLW